jgi:hypothetical protein
MYLIQIALEFSSDVQRVRAMKQITTGASCFFFVSGFIGVIGALVPEW